MAKHEISCLPSYFFSKRNPDIQIYIIWFLVLLKKNQETSGSYDTLQVSIRELFKYFRCKSVTPLHFLFRWPYLATYFGDCQISPTKPIHDNFCWLKFCSSCQTGKWKLTGWEKLFTYSKYLPPSKGARWKV